ncbi:MAG: hypothetical protein AABY22_19885 [Nanoarchaeota archaeon]
MHDIDMFFHEKIKELEKRIAILETESNYFKNNLTPSQQESNYQLDMVKEYEQRKKIQND